MPARKISAKVIPGRERTEKSRCLRVFTARWHARGQPQGLSLRTNKTFGRAKKEKQGANCLPESKISPAFSKAAESKDSVFGRSAHGAKFFSLQKRRRGDETVRGTVSAWGTLAVPRIAQIARFYLDSFSPVTTFIVGLRHAPACTEFAQVA